MLAQCTFVERLLRVSMLVCLKMVHSCMQLLAESNVADFSSGVELFPFARSIRGEAGRVGRERETRLGFRKFILSAPPHQDEQHKAERSDVREKGA